MQGDGGHVRTVGKDCFYFMQPRSLYLQTTHLDLVAMTLVHLDAEEMGRSELGLLLGVTIPKEWPPDGFDRDTMRFFHQRLAAEGAGSVGWYGWYAIRRRTALQPAALVGAGCFRGRPDPSGAVEIRFSVLPEFRGHGHATEIAAALVGYAFTEPAVERVVAFAGVTNRPTISVLMHSGLRPIAPGENPGTVRFERSSRPEPEDEAEGEEEDEDEAEIEDGDGPFDEDEKE